MLKLKGLKDAWEYVFNTIDDELTIEYIKKYIMKFVKLKMYFLWENLETKGWV